MKQIRIKDKEGFSLFEVLVALVILAIGMLGIARMLMITHKSSSSNHMKQEAIQSAYNMIDHIRANRQAAINGNYNASNLVLTGTPTPPNTPSSTCMQSTCSAQGLAAYDTWNWLSRDVTKLPNGCGSISTALTGIDTLVTVTVQWDDSSTQKTLGEVAPPPSQLILESKL